MQKEFFDEASQSMNTSALRLGKYQIAYDAYVAGQEYLDQDDKGKIILSRAIQQLHSLDTIEVIFRSQWIGAKELNANLISPEGSEFSDYPGDILTMFMSALRQSAPPLKSFRMLGVCAETPDDWRQEHERIRAANNRPIRGGGRPYEPLPLEDCATPCSQEFLLAFQPLYGFEDPIYSELERIEIARHGNFHRILGSRNDRFEDVCMTTREILRKCIKLKELTICHLGSTADGTPLEDTLAHFNLPKLESLTLRWCNPATISELVKILCSFASTLKVVHLRFVSMKESKKGWDTAITQLRKHSFSRLQYFELLDCLEAPLRVLEISDYLTRKTDRHPTLDAPES